MAGTLEELLCEEQKTKVVGSLHILTFKEESVFAKIFLDQVKQRSITKF